MQQKYFKLGQCSCCWLNGNREEISEEKYLAMKKAVVNPESLWTDADGGMVVGYSDDYAACCYDSGLYSN